MAGKSLKRKSPELVSLVVPVFNESEGLGRFFERAIPVLEKLDIAWEIICVNDGSVDDSLAELLLRHKQEKRIKVVSLSRNFGKEIALSAGLDFAKGDAVIPIDADLQDPPELIADMLESWRRGSKVVLAVRKKRAREGVFRRLLSKGFYRLFNAVSSVKMTPDAGDFRLLDRRVVDVVKSMPERTRMMKGLFAWPGFESEIIYFEREERSVGESRFGLRGLWRLAWDGLVSFSTLPLVLWIYLGGFVSLCAVGYAVFIAVRTLVFGVDVPGYASLMTAVLFLGGMQLLSLGIIGLYLHKIFKETKQRPLYVVADSYGVDDAL